MEKIAGLGFLQCSSMAGVVQQPGIKPDVLPGDQALDRSATVQQFYTLSCTHPQKLMFGYLHKIDSSKIKHLFCQILFESDEVMIVKPKCFF